MEPSTQVHQPSFINTKTSVLPLSSGTPPPTSSQPFQFEIASLGLKDYADAVSISSHPSIQPFINNWRHANFTSLEVRIFSTGAAPSFPTTVSLAWVPANSAATPANIRNVYGGRTYCVGGSLNSTTEICIPCPLSNLNVVAKSPVTFLDTPKLLISSSAQPSPPTIPTCHVVISGMVEFHSPLLQASSSS